MVWLISTHLDFRPLRGHPGAVLITATSFSWAFSLRKRDQWFSLNVPQPCWAWVPAPGVATLCLLSPPAGQEHKQPAAAGLNRTGPGTSPTPSRAQCQFQALFGQEEAEGGAAKVNKACFHGRGPVWHLSPASPGVSRRFPQASSPTLELLLLHREVHSTVLNRPTDS